MNTPATTAQTQPQSRTVTIFVSAPPERVFDFLSRIENLPKWATGFCNAVRREGEHHKLVTPEGELYCRFDCDRQTGVIDMSSGPTLEELDLFPCRVVDVRGLGTAIIFTFFHFPGMPEEVYDAQHKALVEEMNQLAKMFSLAS